MKSSVWVRGLLVLLLSASAFGANWSGPAGELAKEIAAASGPGTITFSVVNSSALPKDQAGEIQRAIEAQLRNSGVRMGSTASATSDVRVTLSENLQGLLWVAEIKQGNNTQVAMVSVPRAANVQAVKSGPSVLIRKSLLWTQSAHMLDAVLLDNGARLIVLDTDAVSSYVMTNGKWERQQTWPVAHEHPFPRDARGVLIPSSNSVEAYLPGTICSMTFGQSSAAVCREGDDPWKLSPRGAFYNSSRNYFTGATVPATDKAFPPFYSVAWVPRTNYTLALIAGVDGRFRLNDGTSERVLPNTMTSDWGSDLASVKSACGTGTQVLVTSNGDDTMADSLRAYEIADREPAAVSAAADFPGPIMALWSHDSFVTAISKNLRTGQYEAYSVSTTCNQ